MWRGRVVIFYAGRGDISIILCGKLDWRHTLCPLLNHVGTLAYRINQNMFKVGNHESLLLSVILIVDILIDLISAGRPHLSTVFYTGPK